MSTLVIVFHVFICVVLILVVLVQAGKDGGIGAMSGGGSSQTIFGSSGGANFFTRFTSATAALFMITSIVLTVSKTGTKRSVFDSAKPVSTAPGTSDAASTATPPSATTTAPAAVATSPAATQAPPAAAAKTAPAKK